MEFLKPSEEAKDLFARLAPDEPDVELKKMFGCLAAFVCGNMFAGVYADEINIRLGDSERQQFIDKYGAAIFEPMPGRPMKEYVVVPQAVIDDSALIEEWMGKALEYGRSLGQKVKTPKKKRS